MKRIVIPREHYLGKLRAFREQQSIKVITGMRRCGKSTIMRLFRDELITSGIPPGKTYFRNFDDELDTSIRDYRALIDDVKTQTESLDGAYIFLDEIQEVEEWERAVRTFYENGADIYLTGSRSKMLSSELSTKLSGRFVEIEVLPLSFTEFLEFRKQYGPDSTEDGLLKEYMINGGLPSVVLMSGMDGDLVSTMISGIYNTVFIKDVIERNAVRNPTIISNISAFLMKNIGDRTSINRITGFLNSRRAKTSAATIESYVDALVDANLFRRVKRKDSKTKNYIQTSDKYYANDLGVRNTAIGYDDTDIDGLLENLVLMELLFRYGNACTMNVDGKEIDFVSYDSKKRPIYFQVSVNINDEKTREKELAPFRAIGDNYPKTVVTLDEYPFDCIDGFRIIGIADFLSEKDLE